jgi:CheY-like chemotaxis protein
MHTEVMPGPSGQRKLPSILLIDDDQVSREVTAALLSMNGYSVRTAGDGAAALEMLEATEFEPDAILMDVQMPGLKEAPLISKLRDRSKAKVIVVSASNPPEGLVAAADGFLLKPFAAEALNRLLREPSAAASEPARGIIETPVISAETLAHLRNSMPESAVREIYRTLLSDLERNVLALEAAIANGDAAEVSRIGHAIKGGCGMAGALEASRVGALLEASAQETPFRQKSDEWDNSVSLVRELRTAVRNLEVMIEGEFPA